MIRLNLRSKIDCKDFILTLHLIGGILAAAVIIPITMMSIFAGQFRGDLKEFLSVPSFLSILSYLVIASCFVISVRLFLRKPTSALLVSSLLAVSITLQVIVASFIYPDYNLLIFAFSTIGLFPFLFALVYMIEEEGEQRK